MYAIYTHQSSLISPLIHEPIWEYKPLFKKYLGLEDKVIFPKPTEDSRKALALLTSYKSRLRALYLMYFPN